jgi:hypothetical protein
MRRNAMLHAMPWMNLLALLSIQRNAYQSAKATGLYADENQPIL